MKVAREGQRRKGHKNSWQNADQLDDEQLEVLTGKTKLEKALDEMIKSIADEVYTDVRRRDEAALGILGQYSGLADNKNNRADLTALKKLKDSKLDKMDTDPDSRTAGLIRTQIGLLVKANIKNVLCPWAQIVTGTIGSANREKSESSHRKLSPSADSY